MAKQQKPLIDRQKMYAERKRMYAERKKWQEKVLAWDDRMLETLETMPDEERQAFEEWEKANVDGAGRLGTDDWPGWEKYLGKKPKPWYEVIKTDDDAGRMSATKLVEDFEKRYRDAGVPQDVAVYHGQTAIGEHSYYFSPVASSIVYNLLRKHKALLWAEEPDLEPLRAPVQHHRHEDIDGHGRQGRGQEHAPKGVNHPHQQRANKCPTKSSRCHQ
jgi:hypothetical protein